MSIRETDIVDDLTWQLMEDGGKRLSFGIKRGETEQIERRL
jgi:hypothetical protein